MIRATAVYENGHLKPSQPLNLEEGQTVQLRIETQLPLKPLRLRTPEEEEFARRIKASKTTAEFLAVIDSAPESKTNFDVVEAINETRRLTGFRMPDSES